MSTITEVSTMPKGVRPIFCIQIVSTLSFSILYSTLVLYMKGSLGLPTTLANSIMGVFVAFNYTLHLLGGYWGGRFISYRALFCLGMFALALGCFLLSFNTEEFLYYGLGCFLTGAGLNVTCLNCMLTQLFSPEDNRRERAFLWNYAGMNIGFFIGFSVSGYFQLIKDYESLFILSSLGNIIALFLCFFCWKALGDKETIFKNKDKSSQIKTSLFTLGLVLILPFLLSKILHHSSWANQLVLFTGITMLFIVAYLGYKQPTVEARDKIYAFSILLLASVVFWMLFQIAPMGLVTFIESNVRRDFGTWIIPPQWFQNINTITIVIGGPLLAYLLPKLRAMNIDINIPKQFSLALMFIGIAFIILPLGILFANNEGFVNPGWVLASFILQSIGELLLSPIGYAMIGRLAPTHLQGTLMGIWMLSTGVGASLSSYSSNWMIAGQESSLPELTNPGYSQVFLILGIIALFAALILKFLVPRLCRLMHIKPVARMVMDSKLSQI